MKKYNIIHAIPFYSSIYGGPPYVARALNTLFNRNRYKSILLTLGNKNEVKNTIFFKPTTANFWYSYDFMVNSIKHIKNADIVFIHGIYTFISLWSSIIAKYYKKQVYILPHGMFDKNSIESSSFLKNNLRKFYLNSVGTFQVNNSIKVIFNSHKEMNNSIFKSNGCVIPNGVDLDYINSIQFKKEDNSLDKITLFFLGRLNKIKGIELILEAINNLEYKIKMNIEVIIAGTGDKKYVDFLKEISDKNIVKFIGHVEGDRKYIFLKKCDIYLQPSFTEGLSISMLEAMACHVSMITTNRVGLFDELVENDAAKVIAYNSNELQYAITELMMTKNKYPERGYRMIKEKYNWNIIIKDYIKLIG
jgi:glycosyltransferase involved in cell wall biosynthesis